MFFKSLQVNKSLKIQWLFLKSAKMQRYCIFADFMIIFYTLNLY